MNVVNNPGLFIKKYDSINLGLSYLVLWVPITGLLGSIFGEESKQTIFFRILQILYILGIVNALPAASRIFRNVNFLFFFILLLMIYFFSYIECSDDGLKFDMNRMILLWCIPYLFMSLLIKDVENLLFYLRYVGFLIIFIEFLNCVVFSKVDVYSQDVGYNCVLPIVLFFSSFLFEKKKFDLLFVILGFVIVLFSGSRGPLLSSILGLILTCSVRLTIKKVIYLILFFSGLFVAYILYKDQILSCIIDLFASLGVSTRVVEGLLYNNLGDDEVRDSLRNAAWLYSCERPFIGGGFFMDRIYLYNLNIIASKTASVWGCYCHNIFLELMMQFGLIPGLLIGCTILRRIFFKITGSDSYFNIRLIIIFVSIGLFPLLVSRSWITYPFFYFLVGLLFNPIFKNKKSVYS